MFVLGWALLSAVSPAVAEVVVATRAIPAGSVLDADDVVVRSWPVGLIPDAVLSDPAAAVGAASVTAISQGEPLTSQRLLPTAGMDLTGRVTVVAGLADPWAADLVAPGSRVDVYGAAGDWPAETGPARPARPLAHEAVVVRVLGRDARGEPSGVPGLDLGTDDLATDGSVALVLGVTPQEVAAIAALAGQGVTISTTP